nr:CHAP domain-containing protein [Bifidobacterium miconisargentati]
MEWIWWVYQKAGLSPFLSDGATSGWPHHNFDWYRSRGRVSWTPRVGDLAFYKWSSQEWGRDKSATHAAIVVGVEHGHVYVADAAFDNIDVRDATVRYGYALQGYAHPYYNE